MTKPRPRRLSNAYGRLAFLEKRIYGINLKGLGNRLEGYTLAYAFHRTFGHAIMLDWPEFDVLNLGAASRGRPSLFDRLFAQRFYRAEHFLDGATPGRRVILKTLGRNQPEVTPFYLEAAAQVRLRGEVCVALGEWFAALEGRPLVAAHVRRGDFSSTRADRFSFPDLFEEARQIPSVPLWWYQTCLRKVAKLHPGLTVLVCTNGGAEVLQPLSEEFNVTTFDSVAAKLWPDVSERKKFGHIVDLFGLACCNAVLGQPYSSFSHWAANVLRRAHPVNNPVQTSLLPPNGISREQSSAIIPEYDGPMLSDAGDWAFKPEQAGKRLHEAEDFAGLDFGFNTRWLLQPKK